MAVQAADPLTSNFNSLAAILNLFAGKNTKQTQTNVTSGGNESRTSEQTNVTSGGGSTEETVFDPKAIENMVRTLMEGTQGLAAVSSGQKAPGLYNSSTRQLLTNDLLARVTGQVAERSARKVITKEPITQTQSNTVTSIKEPTTTTQTTSAKVDAPISGKTGTAIGAGVLASILGSKKGRAKLFEGLGLDELLSLGIPLEAGGATSSSGNAAASAGTRSVDPFNLSARFPGAADVTYGSNFDGATSFSAMSAALEPRYGPELAAPYVPPPPPVIPEPIPVEPVVTPPVAETTPVPTPEAIPDVSAPPAAPPTTYIPPPPPKPLRENYSKLMDYVNAYTTWEGQIMTYSSTYGIDPQVAAGGGGGSGTPPPTSQTGTDNPNFFQGQPTAPSGGGGTVTVDPYSYLGGFSGIGF